MTDLEYEPLPKEDLLALGEDDDPREFDELTKTIYVAITRLHSSDLLFGGDPRHVDPSGWTKGTFPAAAKYIADRVREIRP